MKKNVFCLVLVIVIATFTGSLFSFASESKKELETRREILLKGKRGPDFIASQPLLFSQKAASLPSNLVTAFVDEENLVTICFNQAIEDDNVLISISDESGSILFETSVIVDQAMEVPIPMEIDASSGYILEIYSSSLDLEGEF